ncbi:beta-ketoacyl synthase N-terminal-like domain-containing protein, partial [Paenibacillus sp.]|uniref:type I polyketide synthase n=1 Tax=Paenibacillus sp. TaxID=58172 RepID=UPI00282B188C
MKSAENIIYELVAEQKLSPEDASSLFKAIEHEEKDTCEGIAIIGMSLSLPKARNAEEFWSNLVAGKDCIDYFPENRSKDAGVDDSNTGSVSDAFLRGGYLDEVDKFDPSLFRVSPQEAKLMDPSHRIMLMKAWEAFEDAGYSLNKIKGMMTGVYIGIDHTFRSNYGEHVKHKDFFSQLGKWTSVLAGRISYLLNLHGPNMVVDTACSAGLVSVHLACKALQNGECDMALAGGVNLFLSPYKNNNLDMVQSPDSRLRAFDKEANGTVWGEGVCAYLLKPLSKALQDGDNIQAVIKGSAVNNDGASSAMTAPNADAQEQVILSAWKDAGISGDLLSYVACHGTGTVLGDPIEIKGLSQAFRKFTDRNQFCAIGSVKGNVGHSVAVSGLASLAKVILAMRHGLLPPNIHFNKPNPYISFVNSPVYVNDRLTEWDTGNAQKRAAVSSFGFSGTNCHMVIESPPLYEPSVDHKGEAILPLSAKSEKDLEQVARSYAELFRSKGKNDFHDVCFTAATGRNHYRCRLAVLASSAEEALHKLEYYLETKESLDESLFAGSHHILKQGEENQSGLTEEELALVTTKVGNKIRELTDSDNYSPELHKELCQLYIAGAEVNWDALYKGKKHRRVSVPGYPMGLTRYWIEEERLPIGFGEDSGHPLLGRLIADTAVHSTYKSILSPVEHWILTDHQLVGHSILPGTGYIEAAREACSRFLRTDKIELLDILFMAPLSCEDDESKSVFTIVTKEEGHAKFVICTELDGVWATHAEGKAVPSDAESFPIIDLDLLEKEIDTVVEVSSVKETTNISEFGPRWANYSSIKVRDQKQLISIQLPEKLKADQELYFIHPAMLDNAVNLFIRLSDQDYYLPFSYKRMRIYGRMPERFYSYVQSRRGMDGKRETLTFDIDLAGPDGVVFMRIEGYTIKKVHSKDFILGRKDLFYGLGWKRREFAENADTWRNSKVLVLGGEDQRILELCAQLKDQGAAVTLAELGATFSRIAEDQYQIGATEADYIRLLDELQGRQLTHVIHLASLGGPETPARRQELEDMQTLGIYSLTRLVRALAIRGLAPEVLIGTDYAAEVTGAE